MSVYQLILIVHGPDRGNPPSTGFTPQCFLRSLYNTHLKFSCLPPGIAAIVCIFGGLIQSVAIAKLESKEGLGER